MFSFPQSRPKEESLYIHCQWCMANKSYFYKCEYYFCSCLVSPHSTPIPFPPKYDVSETDPFSRHQVVFTKPQVSGLCRICCKTPSSETHCFNATVISSIHWPRVLKHRSAAADLLGLRIRIPPKTRMSFWSFCC